MDASADQDWLASLSSIIEKEKIRDPAERAKQVQAGLADPNPFVRRYVITEWIQGGPIHLSRRARLELLLKYKDRESDEHALAGVWGAIGKIGVEAAGSERALAEEILGMFDQWCRQATTNASLVLYQGMKGTAERVREALHPLPPPPRPLDPLPPVWDAKAPLAEREVRTRRHLMDLRSATSIYYGTHEGWYPPSLKDAEFLKKPIDTHPPRPPLLYLPFEEISGSQAAIVVKIAKGQPMNPVLTGKGGWAYDPTTGNVWVNLNGKDSKGVPYSSW